MSVTLQNIYETRDLILRVSSKKLAREAADYFKRNREFLEPFESTLPVEVFTERGQKLMMGYYANLVKKGVGFRFWISPKSDPRKIIGSISLNNVVMGSFKSCFLGYRLDKDYVSRGYMTQAIRQIVRIAFDDVGLHRIEANIMPHNIASIRAAEKAGLVFEGMSKQYLWIHGAWHDHAHYTILNSDPRVNVE